MQRFILVLFLTSFFCGSLHARDKKALMLIIASDNQPVYIELQKLWRTYMHQDRKHIEAYFIKGDPNLNSDYAIKGDTIWSKTVENMVPGIFNKTILSIEAMAHRKEDFDYVIRTNLSSFYIFPRLLQYMKTLPTERCYCSYPLNADGICVYGSGAGIILSRDVAEKMVRLKKLLFHSNYSLADDTLIGIYCILAGIDLIPSPRLDIPSLEAWKEIKDHIPQDTFHIRAKNMDERLRAKDEVYVYSQLINMFYR